jgi:levanase/fructan beta-fructosidase
MRFSQFPDMPFNQQVTFPCELTLRSTPEGLRVFREPIRELALLHDGQDAWTNRMLKADNQLSLEPSGRLFHISAGVSIPEGAKLTFNIRGFPVVFTSKTIKSGTKQASVADQIKTIEILVDRASVEVFVNRGEISLTKFVLFKENGLSLRAEGGSIALPSLTVYPLRSAWDNRED